MDYRDLDEQIRWHYRDDLYTIIESANYSYISQFMLTEYFSKGKSGEEIARICERTKEWFYDTLRKWGYESKYLTGGPYRSEKFKAPRG